MRFDRLGVLSLGMLLAGCVTTHSNSLGTTHIPSTSKAQDAEDAARVHTELAQHYMASGNLQGALAKLKLALKFDSGYAPAHTVIAVLYERIHNLPAAEQHYRKAVALEPDKGAPNNNLGQFLCSVGKADEATGYFRKAVADPFYQTPDVALTNAGICQMHANDVKGAEASFRDAIARNPQNADALLQLADLLYSKKNDAFHALAFLQRHDDASQPTASSLKLGHDIEIRLGNPEAAQTYNKRLQSQFPDSEQAHALDVASS